MKKAKELRQLTDNYKTAVNGEKVKREVELILSDCRKAAERGASYEISFLEYKDARTATEAAIVKALQAEGFIVDYLSNDDSLSYLKRKVSW